MQDSGRTMLFQYEVRNLIKLRAIISPSQLSVNNENDAIDSEGWKIK